MDALEPLRLLADYNRWMNGRLYGAAERLPESGRTAPRGAFFGSIAGTLGHLVTGDSLWLRRFMPLPCAEVLRRADHWLPRPAISSEPRPPEPWVQLRALRERIDGLIVDWLASLAPEHLQAVVDYRNSRDEPNRLRLGLLLVHFFNHQTHHRGQATTLLTQAGVDPGVTDLLAILPREAP